MNKRNILIIASSTLVASGLGYFIYTKFRNKNEIAKIHKILDDEEGSYGSVEDYAQIFTGDKYVRDLQSKYNNLIMLRPDFITAYRKALNKAIQYWGTDEDAIKDVFRKLKDRVQVAQVSASYQKNYGENLLDALKGEMDGDEETMRELESIVMDMPAFRLNK
ncbi:MAG: hypothetical protein ACW98D_17500 [Promethearchaeota archaeon]|jgi:hypothetical protein